jgi:hypothetical protein
MSPNELSKLYYYISDENQTFENISKMFNSQFNLESQTKAINAIIILLKDNLLNISQRIICYFILYNISIKEKMETNPFLIIILDCLKNSNDINEQSFLIDFLYKKINYVNKTIKEYLKEKKKEMKISITQIQIQWEKYYKELLKQMNINNNSDIKMRQIIYERNTFSINAINKSVTSNVLSNVHSLNEINLNFFENNYMSFKPNNNYFFNSEPVFLLPNIKHCFFWEK